MDFDRLFGTWVEYSDYKEHGSIRAVKDTKKAK
jgi:hypothetical protein